MSRQEIDRILGDDLTDIDDCINKRIKAIDSISNKVSMESGFLAQFQQMLMAELKKQGNEAVKEGEDKQPEGGNRNKSQENQESSENEEIALQVQQFEQILPVEEEKKENQIKIMNKAIQLRQSIQNLHHLNSQLSSMFKSVLQQQKNELSQIVSQSVQKIIEKVNLFHQHQLSSLKQQNQRLQQQISRLNQELQSQRQPLKEVTFNVQQEPLTSRKSKPKALNFDLPQSVPFELPHQLSIVEHSRPLLTGDSSFEFFRNQPQQQTQRAPTYQSTHINDEVTVKLTQIKPLCIGVPPVKNGFGVLRSGPSTIYKGMWTNGKFQGKGKLTFGGYSYEGDFRNGLFDGYGKLQIGSIVYMGKFRDNKASGQGSYHSNLQQLQGYWQNNTLIQKY